MGIISLVIPQIGQPDTTEDVKVQNAFTTIQTVVNGNIDSTNLSAATSQSACVNASGQTVKGSSIIATSQSTSSAGFVTLATPDQVTGIVLSAPGLIEVFYQATWQESVLNGARAALFLGANSVKIANFGQPGPIAALTGIGHAATPLALSSFGGGLVSLNFTSGSPASYTGDVTTGQILGVQDIETVPVTSGGPCTIFAAAGTYTVSVQFLATSGTTTVSNRRLYVKAESYA